MIADGAAFGAMIENCLAYLETRIDLRVSIWLPESFEYLILKSGVIKGAELEAVLEEPADYIDSLQHESWEQFFTDLLISLTKDTAAKYSKEVLNSPRRSGFSALVSTPSCSACKKFTLHSIHDRCVKVVSYCYS